MSDDHMASVPPKKPEPSNLQTGCGCLAIFILGLAAYQGCTSTDTNSPVQPVAAPKPAATSRAERLKALDAKSNPAVLEPLDRKYDPEGYKKLGKRVWDTGNALRHWAAVSAAQSDKCEGVTAVAIWERATHSQLSWHVLCGNDERFIIPEAHARAVKAHLDPDATPEERKRYAFPAGPPPPLSAAFANFDVAQAVVACDNLMEEASVDKGSYDAAWSWDEARDEENGHAIISRDYSAKNAMGGTLSGKYRCVVDANSGQVMGLTAQDAFGVHRVL